jgi:hypothetical protein
LVFPYLHRAYVVANPEEVFVSDRMIELPVTLPASGSLVVDLRDHSRPDESLRKVSMAVAGANARIGRDVMLFGGFEDYTIDDEATACAHWSLGAAGALETDDPYRGAGALCSHRTDENTQASRVRFRFRVRVLGEALPQPEKAVSLVTYQFAENAGASRIVASYLSSEGPTVHGAETVLERVETTHGWQLASADLTIPPEALEGIGPPAIRLSLWHEPPESGQGRLCHDELALVSWEEELDIEEGATLETPHARDFLRIEAPAGHHTITLTFRSLRPRAALGD